MSVFQVILMISINFIMSSAFAGAFAVPVQEGDQLVIRGVEAQVQLIPTPGVKALKVNGIEGTAGEGAFVLSKKDNVIEVRMNGYDGKNAWMSALAKGGGQLRKIEISSPSIPVDIQLRNGSLTAQKWGKDIRISLSQGRISLIGGVGALNLYTQKGEVNVQDHAGIVRADSYSGVMTLKNIQGDIDASLFSGPLVVEKSQGFCVLSSRVGPVKVAQSSGTLSFENGKGVLSILGFAGRIDGQNQDGSVVVQMALDSEVDIKSKTGRIQITAPASSGSSVNLTTVEGDIFVPNELRVNKLSSEKNVRGRLRGESQRGSILVRSQEGSIVVK